MAWIDANKHPGIELTVSQILIAAGYEDPDTWQPPPISREDLNAVDCSSRKSIERDLRRLLTRGTGRTTHILAEAVQKLAAGRNIRFVAKSMTQAVELRNKTIVLPHKAGISVYDKDISVTTDTASGPDRQATGFVGVDFRDHSDD